MTHLIIHHNILERRNYLLKMVNDAISTDYSQISQLASNPDIHMIELTAHVSIKIEDVKTLQKELLFKPFQSKYQIGIILHAENMTIEAQNAMLKSLEEQSPTTLFFLLTGTEQSLLPTIISRSVKHYVKTYELDSTEQKVVDANLLNDATKPLVLEMSILEQFLEIERLVSSEKESKGTVNDFLSKLQKYFRTRLHSAITSGDITQITDIENMLNSILTAQEQFSRNINKRLLLENLLLQLGESS